VAVGFGDRIAWKTVEIGDVVCRFGGGFAHYTHSAQPWKTWFCAHVMGSRHSRLCNAVVGSRIHFDRFNSSQINMSSSLIRTNIEATCRPGAPITCTALGILVPTWNQPSDSVADGQVSELTFLVTHDLANHPVSFTI
jgi:hypothetical protein